MHNYHQHRDPGIGFENELKTGYFGALYEAEDYVPVSAFNIEEKRRYVDLGQRRDVDVDTLVSLVDDYIPELAHLTPRLRSMTSSVAAKLQLPVRKTKIHPLGCSTCLLRLGRHGSSTTRAWSSLVETGTHSSGCRRC